MGDITNMYASKLFLPEEFRPIDFDNESDHESSSEEPFRLPFSAISDESQETQKNKGEESTDPLTLCSLLTKPQAHLIKSHNDGGTEAFHEHTNEYIDISKNGHQYLSGSELKIDCEEKIVEIQDCTTSLNKSGLSSPRVLKSGNNSLLSISLNSSSNSNSFLSPVTPTKPSEGSVSKSIPLTPTANLKMLMNAASPEIRNMEKRQKKERLFNAVLAVASNEQLVQESTGRSSDNLRGAAEIERLSGRCSGSENLEENERQNSRKSKSLGLLCERFMTRYPMVPADNIPQEISLDVIAKELKVERRRIYDIINVLESVEMVSRKAKNRYLWHGQGNMTNTLKKLKYLGQHYNFAEQVEYIKQLQDENDFENRHIYPLAGQDKQKDVFKDQSNMENIQDNNGRPVAPLETSDDGKREKSLGVMSQKFIMLFLQSKSKIITLDVAARVLYGEMKYEISDNAKFKTKVRRLYDIANILGSLKMIKKVYVHENRGRKPAFEWIGLNPDIKDMNLEEFQMMTAQSEKRLNPVAEIKRKLDMTNTSSSKKRKVNNTKPAWSRHASLNAIPQVIVAEQRSCSSAPSSPEKSLSQSPPDEKFQQEFAALCQKYPDHVTKLLSPTASDQHVVSPSMTCSEPRLGVSLPITPVTPQVGVELMKLDSNLQATRVLQFQTEEDRDCQKAACMAMPYTTNSQITSSPSPGTFYYVKRYIPLLTPNTLINVQQSNASSQPDSVNMSPMAGTFPPINHIHLSQSSPVSPHPGSYEVSKKKSQNVLVIVNNTDEHGDVDDSAFVPLRRSARTPKETKCDDFEYPIVTKQDNLVPTSNGSNCTNSMTLSERNLQTDTLCAFHNQPKPSPLETGFAAVSSLGSPPLSSLQPLLPSGRMIYTLSHSTSTSQPPVTIVAPQPPVTIATPRSMSPENDKTPILNAILRKENLSQESYISSTDSSQSKEKRGFRTDLSLKESPKRLPKAEPSKKNGQQPLNDIYDEGLLHVRRRLILGNQGSYLSKSPDTTQSSVGTTSPSLLAMIVTNSSNSSFDSICGSPPHEDKSGKKRLKKTKSVASAKETGTRRKEKFKKCKSENLESFGIDGGMTATSISCSRGSLGSQEEVDKILRNNLDSPFLAYLRSHSQETPSPLLSISSPQANQLHSLPRFISQVPPTQSVVIPSPTPGVLVSPSMQAYLHSPGSLASRVPHVSLSCGSLGALGNPVHPNHFSQMLPPSLGIFRTTCQGTMPPVVQFPSPHWMTSTIAINQEAPDLPSINFRSLVPNAKGQSSLSKRPHEVNYVENITTAFKVVSTS